MENVSLREASEVDVPELVRVIRAGFEEYRGRLDPPSGAHTETVDTLRGKLKRTKAVVAIADQQIVACVLYELEHDHVYLGRLAVIPAYRRRGIGRTLLAWVEAQARRLAYPRVRLGVRVVLKENLSYFQNLGYKIVGYSSHPGYTEPTFANLEKDILPENP
jgi:predicted N-acetyltransferase YhbS